MNSITEIQERLFPFYKEVYEIYVLESSKNRDGKESNLSGNLRNFLIYAQPFINKRLEYFLSSLVIQPRLGPVHGLTG